ncbi:MAG: MFS transporter [Catonella sp.]|uniref:MFS transporter n=1 Tax=Catonella sp. TaxID=2382125 RepID=UPI003F9EDE74
MSEKTKIEKFAVLVVLYTVVMGLFQVADYFYGVSYMIILNSHLSVGKISILVGIHEIFLLVFDFPSGVISDFVGRKKTASISLIFYGIGLILLTYSTSFIMLILVFILLAFANAMFSGSPQAWFYDMLIKEDRLKDRDKILPRIGGVVKVMSLFSSLSAVALMALDVRLPLLIGGIAVIIAGITFLIFFEDNRGNIENRKFFEVFTKFSKEFLTDRRMRGMIAFEIFDYTAFSLFIFVWQLFLLNRFHMTEKMISILFVCFTLTMAVGSFLTSFFLKYMNGFTLSVIGKIGIIITFIIECLADNIWLVLVGYILFEFFFSVSSASTGLWKNDYISSNNRASFYSGISSVKSLLFVLLTFCLGEIIGKLGYEIVWGLAAIIEFLSVVLMIRFIRKFGDQKETSCVEE